MNRIFLKNDLHFLFMYFINPQVEKLFKSYDCDIRTYTIPFDKEYLINGSVVFGFSMAPYEQIVVCKLRLDSNEGFYCFRCGLLLSCSSRNNLLGNG